MMPEHDIPQSGRPGRYPAVNNDITAANQSNWRQAARRGRRDLRRWLLAATATGAAGLLMLLLWAMSWFHPPEPAQLVLIGAGYQDNLALRHNVYGMKGLQDLAALVRWPSPQTYWGHRLLKLDGPPKLLHSTTAWDAPLAELSEPTAVLYFSVHGGSDQKHAYLLPQDAAPSRPEDRLLVEDVVRRLAKLPFQKQKVLILDATQMVSNWQFGMLQNDFARQLRELNAQIEAVPNLVVISASDVNQRSWPHPRWRRTAFGHFVLGAIRGEVADLDHDGRMDLAELFQQVAGQTERWVRANYGQLQTPLLLPAGNEGLARARRIDLGIIPKVEPLEDPLPAEVTPQTEQQLAEAWQQHDALAEQDPGPVIYTPVLWRRYETTLLRFQELLIAGDQNAARRMQQSLDELTFLIRQQAHFHLASQSGTLSMAAAAGRQLPLDDKSISDTVERLWAAKPGSYQSVMEQSLQQAAARGSIPPGFRLAVARRLLLRAADDPPQNLKRAAALCGAVILPSQSRPAEVHLLRMLAHHLPLAELTRQDHERLAYALKLRLLAEQAALGEAEGSRWYVEQVSPAIAHLVEKADRARRTGEDLLFAGAKQRGEADAYLKRAEALYRDAQHAAVQVRRALVLRNRMLSELPYYTEWLGMYTALPAPDQPATADLVTGLELLWQRLHALSELLAEPALLSGTTDWDATPDTVSDTVSGAAPEAEPGTESLQRSLSVLDRHVSAIEESFGDAQTLVRGWQRRMAQSGAGDPHEHGSSVMLPALCTARCAAMLNPRRARSDITQEQLVEQARQNAARQGRLALAVLGRRWFKRAGGDDLETFAQLQHRLDVFGVERQWWQSLATAGDQIGIRLQRMAPTLDRWCEGAEKQQFQEALRRLYEADSLARQLDAAEALRLEQRPPLCYRRQMLAGLMLRQVQRTFDDHWYGDGIDSDPYFRLLADYYLSDAARLTSDGALIDRQREQINNAPRLTWQLPEQLTFTSERQRELRLSLEPKSAAAVPVGRPVVIVEAGPGLEMASPHAGARRALSTQAGEDAALQMVIRSPAVAAAERTPPRHTPQRDSSVTVQGFFRGQRLDAEVPVRLALTPTLTINNHPQPARASLAIEASEEANRQFGGGQGAVAIVLDASGSMGPAAGGTYSSDTKYAVAVRALADVLGGIPAGTSVSLWTFGKALGSEKTVAAAERTIERVLPPTKWDPQVGRDELVHRISYPQTEPWNESPIVRTMLAAKGDLDQAAGPKTLIVITDGADNRFADDPALNPQREEIADVLLRRFGSSGITVHVVGFRTVDAEQGQFQEQFAVVRNFYPPGDFYFVEQADMLRKTLAAPLRQTLRYHLRLADGSPAAKVPHQGQPAALAGADDRWLQPGLPPGDYAVSFGNAAEPRYEVLLERGDLLLLTLGVRQHAIALKRAPFLATRFQQRPSLHVGGWHLAMLQNQALAGGHLQMLLALEADPPTDDSVLGIKRPRRLWLEVTPADKPMTPSSWRWYSAGGYPVPAVAMELFGWPSKSSDNTSERPIVQLWWSMNEEAAGGVTLRRGDDFQSVEQLAGRDLHLHDGPVTLDAVAVEEHAVEVAPGQRELRSCLAVRLRHDPRQRYWVTLDGPRTEGLEQRFYEQAGSYTALFWPVTESQTDQLAAIRIESIETFKKVAAQRGQTASFEHLPPPSPDDARPRPALALPR